MQPNTTPEQSNTFVSANEAASVNADAAPQPSDSNQPAAAGQTVAIPQGLIQGVEAVATAMNKAEPVLAGGQPGVRFGAGTAMGSEPMPAAAGQPGSLPSTYTVPAHTIRLTGPKGAVVGIVVSLILGGAGYLSMKTAQVPSGYKTASGVVVSDEAQTTSSSSPYHAKIQFVANDGKSYSFTDPIGTTRQDYVYGQKVQVAYDPAQPFSNAKNTSNQSGSFYGVILMGVGVLGVLLSVVGLMRSLVKKS